MQGPRTSGIPQAVLAKEAVYSAVGLASFELHDHVDFTPWFRGPLMQVCSAASLILWCRITGLCELHYRARTPPVWAHVPVGSLARYQVILGFCWLQDGSPAAGHICKTKPCSRLILPLLQCWEQRLVCRGC